MSLSNVILWGDTASSDASTAEVKNNKMTLSIASTVIAGGCPIDVDSGCINLVAGSPNLGPLQANGGFTQTMLPGAGSSAIDAGDDTLCPSPDQRGMPRPQGKHCDIGSVETAAVMSPTAQSFTVTTPRDTPVVAQLKGSDSNPGGPFAFTFTVVGTPPMAACRSAGDVATYTPSDGFVGHRLIYLHRYRRQRHIHTGCRNGAGHAASPPVAQPLSLQRPLQHAGQRYALIGDRRQSGRPVHLRF